MAVTPSPPNVSSGGPTPRRPRGLSDRGFRAIVVASLVAMLLFALALFELPTSTPLPACGGFDCSSMFSWGTPMNQTGSAPPGCPLVSGHYCYTIEIVGANLNVRNMNLSLATVNGTIPWPSIPASDTVSLLSPEYGAPVAYFDTATFSWTTDGNFTGVVGGGFTIVVFTGGTGATFGLRGDTLVLHGANGATLTVPSNTFP